MGLKTHAKILLIVRRERGRIARYVHIGTGNYNAQTARVYGDLGLITDDADIGQDVSELFNALTGYSTGQEYRKLLVAPTNLRKEMLSRIERETRLHKQEGGGRLAFKMNALVDEECIRALFRASQAGVRVDLQVRGICCLRPGVRGVSDNIRVTSVVGRFLEHARFYYFRNGGDEELFTGSADLMPRNLNRRVEVLIPIEDEVVKRQAIELLEIHLRDNIKARALKEDGTYERVAPAAGEARIDSQLAVWRLRERAAREREGAMGGAARPPKGASP
jgi:polyphosphate kinase